MKQPQDLAERAFRRRRRQDAALVLPLMGVLLLATPVLALFTKDIVIFGAPLPFLYVFTVWFILILLARRMARVLDRDE